MERRRSFLGWMAIGLGVLVLLGSLVGGLRGYYSFSQVSQPAVVVQDDQRGAWQDERGERFHQRGPTQDDQPSMWQDERGERFHQRGPTQDDQRGMWDEHGSQLRAPLPPLPPQAPRPPHWRGDHGRGGHGFGWLFFLPLMLLGSILRFALFAAVAYFVVRWLQRRDARRNQDPPSEPPHTSDTQSL